VRRPVILVVIKGLGLGGAEKLIAEGARFWDRARFDYRVAYLLPWKDQLVPIMEDLGVPTRCLGGRRGPGPAALFRLRRLIRETHADIVHAHLPITGVMARLVSPVPVVYTEHNLVRSYRPLTRALNRLTYGRNTAVVAVSGAVAEAVGSYPGPTPTVIENGVACVVTQEEAARARSELGLADQAPLVVHVGNIRPHKGHTMLMAAAEILLRLRPDLTIVSIGGEKFPGGLEALRGQARARGLERIHFLGRRPDAQAFIAAADVFVNPADIEGLPVAVLEALSLGRPVVATAVGGVPSVVKHEETGILVEPGDAAALAHGVDRLLRDARLARRLADEGRALVQRDYGLEPMVRSVEQLYETILRG
jgi:glycosyltransferase involved in cell wall biosynthesis